MMSAINYFGAPLFAPGPEGKPTWLIATAFPHYDTVVTLRTIHALQIEAFVEAKRQRPAGAAPMTAEEEREIRKDAVPLVLDGDCVQIRPDPDDMPLAFRADKLLRREFSKRRIKYLNVFNEKVRDALKRRGELYRIARLPTSRQEIKEKILQAKVALGGRPIYYYNATTGNRALTCQEFSQLGDLEGPQLRRHLVEIREFSGRSNAQLHPEITFYMADDSFTSESFACYDFATMAESDLRAVFEDLRRRFQCAVPPEFREDNLDNGSWRHHMFSALVTETDELLQEEVLLSLSPEFFMQVRWLPGGRIRNGELAFDEVFHEQLQDPSAQNAREFLYNLVRSHEDLEYVNIGRVVNSLSRRPQGEGRREVYLAVMKRRGEPSESVSVIRLQKWGVREHLNDGLPEPNAMYKSDEYTEYILDRRFACRYLEMNILQGISARKICEHYVGPGAGPGGIMIWSPYFERAYVDGIATDKMPRSSFGNPEFCRRFARLLGEAAAPDLITGRCDMHGHCLFDDGDEIVIQDESDMPAEIILAEQPGTFRSYRQPLEDLAAAYADPVNRRRDWVANPEEFARIYVEAFTARFVSIQDKYRTRRKAFDTLFQNRPYNPEGSFAFRWEQVLKRLDQTDPAELAKIIQANIRLAVGS